MSRPEEDHPEPTTLSEREAERMFEQLLEIHDLLGPLSAARYEVVDKLERIEESKLGPLLNERCSICYDSFDAIIAKEEQFIAMDVPVSERELGVTKLQGCGHYFCRKDITKWILEGNDLCPYCRTPYLPADTGSRRAADATSTNEETTTSLEAMMEHLQRRWEAAHAGGRAAQRPPSGGMYS